MYRKIERFSITCLKSRIYFFNFGQCIQTSQSQRKANSCIRHARWKTTVDFAFAFYWMKPWSNILTEIQSPTNHANTCDSQMKKNYVILAIKAKSVTSNAINDKRTRRITKILVAQNKGVSWFVFCLHPSVSLSYADWYILTALMFYCYYFDLVHRRVAKSRPAVLLTLALFLCACQFPLCSPVKMGPSSPL